MFSPYRGPKHGFFSNLSKSPREILAIERAAKSFKALPRCSKANDHEIPPIKNTVSESMVYKKGVTCPPVTRVRNATVIIEATNSHAENGDHGLNNIRGHKVSHQKRSRNRTLSWRSWEETKKARRTVIINKERIPSREDTKEKIVVNEKYPKQMVTIKKQLPEHFKKELRNLLRANADIFAWTHADMIVILRTIMVDGKPFKTEHKLNEYSHIKPIKQNKRSLDPDCNASACKEAKEFMKTGILRKVKHQTWVANPVMVKKNDGRWRMCFVFTDINKACPKDCYQLLKIDWKIESLVKFCLKCFLDAYEGYHQIQMAEGDEDKTTFFVGEGVFCYGKMPFGLKNARAKYQRLVDKVFSKKTQKEPRSLYRTPYHQAGHKGQPFENQSRLKKTGRVAKWAIELGEHDIVFLKRDERETSIDFLPEIPFDESEKRVKEKEVSDPSNEWKLYTDGASSFDGAGAGLMLIDPAAPPQTDKIIKEIHKGSCRFNMEPRSMVVTITKQGYYWPSMHREASKTIQDCDKCKEQSAIRKTGIDGAIIVGSGSQTHNCKIGKAGGKVCMGICSVQIRSSSDDQLERRKTLQRGDIRRLL
uniref:Reverse transcriptase domain-containing protein n=1 Tax=Tanacetum cinerariifolium TaxID=118510 RepID=A0A6L2MFX3_TANCI|nr:reverse transcriptase domain-containing protein [Tanacetum cinerariifolium]